MKWHCAMTLQIKFSVLSSRSCFASDLNTGELDTKIGIADFIHSPHPHTVSVYLDLRRSWHPYPPAPSCRMSNEFSTNVNFLFVADVFDIFPIYWFTFRTASEGRGRQVWRDAVALLVLIDPPPFHPWGFLVFPLHYQIVITSPT